MRPFSLLFHPKITLAATIVAVGSVGIACGGFQHALLPLKYFPSLAHYVDVVDNFLHGTEIAFGVIAACLSVVAGLGRSFSPLIDNASKPGLGS
jgi:hypothetical protein